MSFTLSFVIEVLIGGCFCSVWVAFLINRLAGGDLDTLVALISKVFDLGTAGLFLGLISTYILGWVSQYFCDLIFDNFFEKRIKKSPFAKKSDFHQARGVVMQGGSKTILDDIQMDRQLLRLSKQICLNFSLIAIFVFLYVGDSLPFSLIVAGVSVVVAIISFLQWVKRYVSVMYKFYRAEQSIQALQSPSDHE